ncbi:carbamoyltransferase HypF [Candidatus Margulisiibacteriota bacterium]
MIHRYKIVITGIVQGVGYRPFIYTLAEKLNIKGWVSNSRTGVVIDVEGPASKVNKFIKLIKSSYPPLARPEAFITSKLKPAGYRTFDVKESITSDEKSVLVSPDFTICDDCLKEIRSKKDRRHSYPFTTCTNCGPRFSIIKDTPYDRNRTTMNKFNMCEECGSEYKDPRNRRFHAEPNACETCGPHYTLYKIGKKVSYLKMDDPIEKMIKLLKAGKIVAVKGIGGFLLVCDATNDKTVQNLRIKKDRNEKPFAIMTLNVKTARKFCKISKAEEKLLTSKERPIVLLEKKEKSIISKFVAPGNKDLGVMLAYAPVHFLLLEGGFQALVATSGNRAENPITKDLDESIEELEGINKYFLDHNREIYMSVDDSVARIMNNKPYMIRRARGFTPAPINSDIFAGDILAVGAEMKNTFCVTRTGKAFISQHIGDLKTPNNLKSFHKAVKHFKNIFKVVPKVIAHDLHPEYLSTRFAKGLKGKKIAIQHHHAHTASVMAENELKGKVIGISYDGTGFGDDRMIWGGEILVADYKGYKRSAHLKYMPLPGGDKANKEPYRMAVSYLNYVFGDDFRGKIELDVPKNKVSLINEMIGKDINCPKTSSMGRFFDAVSSILGICQINSFEGQGAIRLEHSIDGKTTGFYKFDINKEKGSYIIDPRKIIIGIINDINSKKKRSYIAAKFHNTVVMFTLEICKFIRKKNKLNKVCLSGGCFQNKYLTEKLTAALQKNKFKVYTHSLVPPNDGGISLGQAAIASARLRGRSS